MASHQPGGGAAVVAAVTAVGEGGEDPHGDGQREGEGEGEKHNKRE